MGQKIHRSYKLPLREDLSWDERWKGSDRGLITCWELGRELMRKEPKLAMRAMIGELPILPWKGGVEAKTEKGLKYGSLYYLAQLQGLRGNDLDIDPTEDLELQCTKTGMRVIYTNDPKKYGNS